MPPEDRATLMGVTCATLTTALFKRGFPNVFLRDLHPVARKGRNMVDPAYTLRYISAREDLDTLDACLAPDHPQRVAMEHCPEGRPGNGQP